jgi:hypothetical protein
MSIRAKSAEGVQAVGAFPNGQTEALTSSSNLSLKQVLAVGANLGVAPPPTQFDLADANDLAEQTDSLMKRKEKESVQLSEEAYMRSNMNYFNVQLYSQSKEKGVSALLATKKNDNAKTAKV